MQLEVIGINDSPWGARPTNQPTNQTGKQLNSTGADAGLNSKPASQPASQPANQPTNQPTTGPLTGQDLQKRHPASSHSDSCRRLERSRWPVTGHQLRTKKHGTDNRFPSSPRSERLDLANKPNTNCDPSFRHSRPLLELKSGFALAGLPSSQFTPHLSHTS